MNPFIKSIILVLGLFFQTNSLSKAMETPDSSPPYPCIFDNKDIVLQIISHIEPPSHIVALRNLSLTNKEFYNRHWNNEDFWASLPHNPNYLDESQKDKFKNLSGVDKAISECKSLFNQIFSITSQKPPVDLTPQRFLFAVGKDIEDLMGISLTIVDEENRQRKRKVNGLNRPYEIKITTSLEPLDIYDRLCRIRQFETQFSYEEPFTDLSIFSLPVRYQLWVGEWALLTYLESIRWTDEENFEKKSIEYMSLVFPKKFKQHKFEYDQVRMFKHYFFIILTQDSFLKYPPASLLFSLSARKRYAVSLINPLSDPIRYDYDKIPKMTESTGFYFGFNLKINIPLKRRECMLRALTSPETFDAQKLYQEHLHYECDEDKKEIEGLKEP